MATPRRSPQLDRVRVLICRPEPEAHRLGGRLQQAGAAVKVLPMLERVTLDETPAQRTLIQNVDQFQHVIAVSPYAARLLLERLDTWWPQLPVGLSWYGVGTATAAEFQRAGLTPVAPAEGFTSEHLLGLPSLSAPIGERVLLARGEQGRDLIRDTLRQRGADISELSLYQRRSPNYSQADIDDALCTFNPDVIITLSGETLNNLIALGKNTNHNLKQRLLVVPAERVAEQARRAGFQKVCLPDGLDDDAIVTCITDHLALASHDTAD